MPQRKSLVRGKRRGDVVLRQDRVDVKNVYGHVGPANEVVILQSDAPDKTIAQQGNLQQHRARSSWGGNVERDYLEENDRRDGRDQEIVTGRPNVVEIEYEKRGDKEHGVTHDEKRKPPGRLRETFAIGPSLVDRINNRGQDHRNGHV